MVPLLAALGIGAVMGWFLKSRRGGVSGKVLRMSRNNSNIGNSAVSIVMQSSSSVCFT